MVNLNNSNMAPLPTVNRAPNIFDKNFTIFLQNVVRVYLPC